MAQIDSGRLCIDARLPETGGAGVATYTDALVQAAAAAGFDPGRLRATARRGGAERRIARWARAAVTPRIDVAANGIDLVAADPFRLAHVRFRQTGRMLRLRASGPPGIMHWTYPVPALIEGWANLYTVHDAIPLLRPDLTPIDPRRHRRLLAAVTAAATRVVAVSASGARDVVAATGCEPALVVDCGQAVSLPGGGAALPAGLSPGGYLLFCGQIEPRKNLSRLIDAWRLAGCPLPLVFTGPPGWRAAPILEQARAAGIVHLGYLPRAVLTTVIGQARALVLPSLAEGFGLPLAEAMALGTPALISRDPALVEVAGGAALSVEAEDVGALAAGLARIAGDADLAAELRRGGRARAAAFSIAAFGERLRPLYAQAFARIR